MARARSHQQINLCTVLPPTQRSPRYRNTHPWLPTKLHSILQSQISLLPAPVSVLPRTIPAPLDAACTEMQRATTPTDPLLISPQVIWNSKNQSSSQIQGLWRQSSYRSSNHPAKIFVGEGISRPSLLGSAWWTGTIMVSLFLDHYFSCMFQWS